MNLNKKNKIIISAVVLGVILAGLVVYTILRPAPGLDQFVVMTKSDPLFYSPFFNDAAYASALTNLDKSEEVLKKTGVQNLLSNKGSYTQSYIDLIQKHRLFPTNFLGTLPSISRITDAFIKHPTSHGARKLLAVYDQAQRFYDEDASSMNQVFAEINEHIPADHPLFYFFTDSATSLKVVENDFDLIHKNSLALKKEIESRRNCLAGKESCPANHGDQATVPETVPVAATGKNADFIHDTLPFADEDRKINGPYTISSGCWADSSKGQPMYAIYSTRNGVTSMLPKLANQNYYRLVSPNATDAISKKVNSLGLEFYSQPEGTTYECSDLRFYPEILSLDFIHNHNDLSPADTILLWNNQFGLLAPAFQALADYTNLLEASQRASKDFVLSPQFLFTTRSTYSLTYLPFAHSVWRIDEQPQYLISRDDYNRMGAPEQFKTLTELQKAGFSQEAIKKSHINQRELIESLVR